LCAVLIGAPATFSARRKLKRARHLFVGPQHAVDYRRSPFFSAAFVRRLQKMIAPARGPATDIERAIERALARLTAALTRLGR
jgi:hypothetical protein